MNNVGTLIGTDLIAIRRWFSTQRTSKLIVLLAFGIVFAGVAIGLFIFSKLFFQDFASNGRFGLLTAGYMIHAVIVMVAYLAIASSLASTFTFLLTPNKQIDFLVCLPLKPRIFILWVFIKSIILNFVLLLMLLSPVILAFQITFQNQITFSLLVRVCITLLALVLATTSVAEIIGYYSAPFIEEKGFIAAILGIVLFFALAALVLRLIFPQSLFILHDASPNEFFALYNRLPLVSPLLPTSWLTTTIVSGFSIQTLLAILFALLLSYLAQNLLSHRFLGLFQALKIQPHREGSYKSGSTLALPFFTLRQPFIYKDWLSVIRLPSEVRYGLFLLFMALFFFLLISYANRFEQSEFKLGLELVLFSFSWLLFFTTSYLLRLVFPLMAREIEAAWYLFTLPISRIRILRSKVLFGMILTLPHILLGISIWFLFPFFEKWRTVLIINSIIAVVILTLVHGLMGAISPNFDLGRDPEKVSTGSMGILTLLVSFFVIALTEFLLYVFMKGMIGVLGMEIIIASLNILLLIALLGTARSFLRHYEF